LIHAENSFCDSAQSKYGDKRKTIAMCLQSVKRNYGLIINYWTKKWNMDIDSMDQKEGKKAYSTTISI
jgi:hypothetical protein